MQMSQSCQKLLKQGRDYQVTYGNRLGSHLPMALIALDKLNADEEKLEAFYQNYITRLQPLETVHYDTPLNLRETLGDLEQYPYQLIFFQQEIKQKGVDRVLHEYLPVLLPGVCGSAFHPLIRLAYALEVSDPEEVAAALAYWAAEYEPLGPLGESVDKEPIEILQEVAPIGKNHSFSPGIIVDKMREIVALESFQQQAIQPKNLSFETLAKIAIDAFSASNSFTLLHGVTSLHALRVILPKIENQEAVLPYFWQAFVVAYLSTGSVNIDHPKTDGVTVEESWEEILKKATQSTEEHTIKMVYTCWSEYNHYQLEEYKIVASQLVNRKS